MSDTGIDGRLSPTLTRNAGRTEIPDVGADLIDTLSQRSKYVRGNENLGKSRQIWDSNG